MDRRSPQVVAADEFRSASRWDIAVQVLTPEWRRDAPDLVRRVRRVALAVLDRAAAKDTGLEDSERPAELAVVLANDERARRLNRDYRGIDTPTNVLSFSGLDSWRSGSVGAPIILGDIVLARETVVSEALLQGKSVSDHMSHLIVHGVLHLLGYGHGTSAEARIMERIEIQILGALGVANPYDSPVRGCAGPQQL